MGVHKIFTSESDLNMYQGIQLECFINSCNEVCLQIEDTSISQISLISLDYDTTKELIIELNYLLKQIEEE